MQGEAANYMAGGIVSPQPCRLTLHLVEIKLSIIELIFGEDRHVPRHEILRARQRIQADSAIVTASSKLIGGLGEENTGAHPGIELEGTARISSRADHEERCTSSRRSLSRSSWRPQPSVVRAITLSANVVTRKCDPDNPKPSFM